jgi:hypothetical protein
VRSWGEIGVGWIGGNDALINNVYYDLISPHHGDALLSTAAASSSGWTLGGTHTHTLNAEQLGVRNEYVGEHCGTGANSFLCECGGLAKMLGGHGVLGAGQYLEKTFGGAGYSDTQQLGMHSALHIELDIVRVDAWNGEMIKVDMHPPL